VLSNVHDRLSLVSLSAAEYLRVVESAGPAGARGGAIYDLLLLACARKVKAAKIHTLNRRHFVALASDLEEQIVSP
jgi:predicted nucleic acid-binding protein